jgi:hypothetical protein
MFVGVGAVAAVYHPEEVGMSLDRKVRNQNAKSKNEQKL